MASSDVSATAQTDLRTNQKAVHEGIKYPCKQCSYEATQKGDLKKHQKAVHEGIKYPCKHCSY